MNIRALTYESMRRHQVGTMIAGVFAIVGLSGCGYLNRSEPLAEDVGLIAVLPIQRDEPSAATSADPTRRLDRGAEDIITAQLYGELSSTSHWRFVPDLTAMDALKKVDRKAGLANRAVEFGKLVNADAVLCGTVSRFVDRVGTEYGATQPASVNFTLQLISIKTGTVLWQGEFDQTQEPLASNLLNAWMFWNAGPHWFSSTELARLGVGSLLRSLDRSANPAGPWWHL